MDFDSSSNTSGLDKLDDLTTQNRIPNTSSDGGSPLTKQQRQLLIRLVTEEAEETVLKAGEDTYSSEAEYVLELGELLYILKEEL